MFFQAFDQFDRGGDGLRRLLGQDMRIAGPGHVDPLLVLGALWSNDKGGIFRHDRVTGKVLHAMHQLNRIIVPPLPSAVQEQDQRESIALLMFGGCQLSVRQLVTGRRDECMSGVSSQNILFRARGDSRIDSDREQTQELDASQRIVPNRHSHLS